jgi:phospholipid/cholesterol/gamma-HCH transport system substrate-binding protein
MTRNRGAILGAFVVVGLLLFASGLFLIGDRRLLFAEQFELHATFRKVTGLAEGTPVRIAGLPAGEVLEIRVPSRPSDPFIVRMRLRDDLRSLVRSDSVPAIQTDGLVGGAFIQISVGTEDASIVSPGDTLPGRDPLEFADLIQEGRDTFRTVASEFIVLRGDVSVAIEALTGTAEATTGMIDNVGRNVEAVVATSEGVVREAQAALADARGLIAEVRSGRGSIGQLLTDDALYDRIVATSREVEQSVRNVREMTDRSREAVESFTARDGTAQQIAGSLRNALIEVQEATADLAEGTEALKRNFLFRGFFNDRGFFDLDAVSREEYLAGALTRDSTALRVWVDGSLLFVADPLTGLERLSDDGRRRLDSAMADLVRYPRDSPLVVEGYAESSAGETAYLRSIDRAQVVREYLLGRFRRRTTLTGIIPMGAEAPGSPRGDGRWSGVALTMFVRNDVLSRTGAAAASIEAAQP